MEGMVVQGLRSCSFLKSSRCFLGTSV